MPRWRPGRAALACLGNLLAADRGVEQALGAGAPAALIDLAQDVRLPGDNGQCRGCGSTAVSMSAPFHYCATLPEDMLVLKACLGGVLFDCRPTG